MHPCIKKLHSLIVSIQYRFFKSLLLPLLCPDDQIIGAEGRGVFDIFRHFENDRQTNLFCLILTVFYQLIIILQVERLAVVSHADDQVVVLRDQSRVDMMLFSVFKAMLSQKDRTVISSDRPPPMIIESENTRLA